MSSFVFCLLGLVCFSALSGSHTLPRNWNDNETPGERIGFLNIIRTIGKYALPVAQKLLSDGDIDAGTAMMTLKNDADVLADAIKDKDIQVRIDLKKILSTGWNIFKNVVLDEDVSHDEDIHERINFLNLLKKGAQFALPIAQKLLSDGDVEAHRALTTFKNDADIVADTLKDKEIQVRINWKNILQTGWNVVKKVAPVVAPIVGSFLDTQRRDSDSSYIRDYPMPTNVRDEDFDFDGDVQQRAFFTDLLKTVAKNVLPIAQKLLSDGDEDSAKMVTRFSNSADALSDSMRTSGSDDIQVRGLGSTLFKLAKKLIFDEDLDEDIAQRINWGNVWNGVKTVAQYALPVAQKLLADGDVTNSAALVSLKADAERVAEIMKTTRTGSV